MLRGQWFLWLGLGVSVLLVLRLALRRPLLARRARAISSVDATMMAVAGVLLVFHCAAMFAPDAVGALRILDGPAAVVRDLHDPVGQAAYWIPAAALVIGMRLLWWPAPVGSALGLLAVGWTMYGDFTLTQHLVAIVVTGITIAVVMTALVRRPTDKRTASDPRTTSLR